MKGYQRNCGIRISKRAVGVGILLACAMLLGGQRVHAQQAGVADHETVNASRAMEKLLARRITLDISSASLESALDSLSHVSKVMIEYRSALIKRYAFPVTVHAKAAPLGEVLERVFDGTHLHVVPGEPGCVTVVEGDGGPGDSIPIRGTVTGRVIDSLSRRGLRGAVVKVAGTKLSVFVGDSGRFVLRDLPLGDIVLTVRLFGYRPTEKAITVLGGQAMSVRIAMVAAPNVLSGVVTTATGVQDRRSVGNDITVINVDSVMQTAPIRNLTDLLEGRVPGLTVQHTSGVPGSPSRLRLRGVTSGLVPGSNHSNDPIMIVDGIRVYASTSTQRNQNSAASGYTTQSGYDQIDPNSIATIEVFKGPSASALYGPDAANGVLVITTKRGQPGSTHVTASANYGLSYMPGVYAHDGYYKFGHDIDDGTPHLCDAIVLSRSGSTTGIRQCLQDSIVPFQALSAPRLSLFGTGHENGASATATGGTAALTYSVTGSVSNTLGYLKMPELYQDQYVAAYNRAVPEWMKRPDTYKTGIGTGSIVSIPTPGLQVTFATSLGTTNQQQSSAQTNIATLSGTYIDTTVLQPTVLGEYTQRVTSEVRTSNNSLAASWIRWALFHVQAVAGTSVADEEDETLVPYGVFGSPAFPSDTVGYFAYGRKLTRVQNVNLNGQLLPSGRVATNVGFNIIKTVPKDFSGVTARLDPGVTSPSAFTIAGQSASSVTTAGWYVEPRLNFNSRVFVAPGFRIDNTGNYRKAGGFAALLPKMDFSWIALDREGQRPALGIFTLLRPRIAFGISGTQPDPTQLLRSYALGSGAGSTGCNQTNNGLCYFGIRLVSVGNPDLRPERARELEFGSEAELWGNRVQLVVSQARRLTLDAVALSPVAPSAGGLSLNRYTNIGNVRNTSTEVSMSATPLLNASTSWTVSATLSTVKNRVLKVNDTPGGVDFGGGIRAVPGYPINGRWERPIIGYVDPGPGQRIGAADVFVGDSAVYVGSPQPSYTLPVQTSLSLLHGAIALSVGVQYEHGLTQFGSGSQQLLTNLYLDSTASLGQQAAVVAAFCESHVATSERCTATGTQYGLIQTVNVLRLQSLSLNYRVPAIMTRRFRLPPASVQLQGSNLGLWSGYRGKDPDVNGTPVGDAIEDSGQEPLPRTWGLRITLGN